MNIKTNGKPINWTKIFLGFDKDESHLYGYIFGTTLAVWLAVLIVASIVYMHNDILFVDIAIKFLSIGGGIGLALAIIGLMGYSDWNRKYGLGLWIRILAYNLLMFGVTMTIQYNVGNQPIIEPVKSMQFVKTDTRDCTYAIKLKSDNMDYTYCESLGSSFDRARDGAKDLKVNLIGYYKYGTYIASNVEFIEKTVTLK